MEVDLHLHSIYSDGEHSPEEVLKMAQDKGLKVLALTDHEEVAGVKKILELSHDGMTIYSGIELNAYVPFGQMHILGYNIDIDSKELNEKVKMLRANAVYNIKLYLKQLKDDYNIVLPDKDVDGLLNSLGNIGRPQLAVLLVKNGYCKTVQEAFENYLSDVKIRPIKKTITKEECIKIITEAGGIAVLAHPWSLKISDEDLHKEVAYLVSKGLKGIEVIHSRNSEERRKHYHDLAQEFNLLETGGTDYHGNLVKPGLELGSGYDGNVNIKKDDLSLIKTIKSRYANK